MADALPTQPLIAPETSFAAAAVAMQQLATTRNRGSVVAPAETIAAADPHERIELKAGQRSTAR